MAQFWNRGKKWQGDSYSREWRTVHSSPHLQIHPQTTVRCAVMSPCLAQQKVVAMRLGMEEE